jgi:hypothetical protein
VLKEYQVDNVWLDFVDRHQNQLFLGEHCSSRSCHVYVLCMYMCMCLHVAAPVCASVSASESESLMKKGTHAKAYMQSHTCKAIHGALRVHVPARTRQRAAMSV